MTVEDTTATSRPELERYIAHGVEDGLEIEDRCNEDAWIRSDTVVELQDARPPAEPPG